MPTNSSHCARCRAFRVLLTGRGGSSVRDDRHGCSGSPNVTGNERWQPERSRRDVFRSTNTGNATPDGAAARTRVGSCAFSRKKGRVCCGRRLWRARAGATFGLRKIGFLQPFEIEFFFFSQPSRIGADAPGPINVSDKKAQKKWEGKERMGEREDGKRRWGGSGNAGAGPLDHTPSPIDNHTPILACGSSWPSWCECALDFL